jgi:uncharacterized protein
MNDQDRGYRNRIFNEKLKSFHITVRETDLFILADPLSSLSNLAYQSVYKCRGYIESYIQYHPDFLTSLVPLPTDNMAPDIVRDMLKAAEMVNVGPMAAVAGAIAEHVGYDIMLGGSRNVIVENGGDIFMQSQEEVTVEIFAGKSPLSHKVRMIIRPEQMPLGVCTSSGTVGHSLSFGKADAVCVMARSAAVADAAATAIGNLVQNKDDIKKALDWGNGIKDVSGILIIVGEQMGIKGTIELA